MSPTSLGKVTTPTLVGHSTRDAVVPFSAGRALAARIPGARFIAIESPNHLLLETRPRLAEICADRGGVFRDLSARA